jgi:hypothetical protein
VPAENLFPLQAVEFSRLVSSLRPDESEDAIVSSCQKLVAMFRQRPEQKVVFVTQHGFLPLMDLLDIPKSRVICAVLQLINEIIKDNTDFQENACLVGLVSFTFHMLADSGDHWYSPENMANLFYQRRVSNFYFKLQFGKLTPFLGKNVDSLSWFRYLNTHFFMVFSNSQVCVFIDVAK